MVSEELSSKLALKNEAVQIQVCADYNFHSEELFKVNYWTKVILTLSQTLSGGTGIVGISASSLKLWWNAHVGPRSLPGLRKVLHVALQQSSELDSLSRLKQSFDLHFFNKSIPQPSIVSRVARFAVSSLYRLAVGGDTTEDAEIDDNEILFSKELLTKIARDVLRALQSKAGLDGGPLDSILVTELDVLKIVSASEGSDSAGNAFATLPVNQKTQILLTLLVEQGGAVGFRVADLSCLKLPLVDSKAAAPVTERDKAYVMSEIAAEKLMTQETSLSDQWALVDKKLREHLAAGRKPLALAALKERKMIEQRMEEIQIYKLKLAESSSVHQTAVIQQAVVQAIAVGTQAARAEMIDIDDTEEILSDAKTLQDHVRDVAHLMADGESVDDSVLLEYEKLVSQQAEAKEMEKDKLIDEIPSPPTIAPVEKAPQVIIPEEWIEE